MYPGLLTLGSSYSLRLPILADSGRLQISSPITVADQWRLIPRFPWGTWAIDSLDWKSYCSSRPPVCYATRHLALIKAVINANSTAPSTMIVRPMSLIGNANEVGWSNLMIPTT
jgi:hypothetical protein